MKTCAKCSIEKDESMFGKDAKRKSGLQPYCKDCNREYRLLNADRIAAYRAQNRQYFRDKNAEWRRANPDKVASANKANYAAMREQAIARVRAWQKQNPGKHSAIQAARTAAILQATPWWADVDEIAGVYELAALFRRAGIQMHVDHIVPLRSPHVCGLHVTSNLQLLPRAVNVVKNNRYWPDMA